MEGTNPQLARRVFGTISEQQVPNSREYQLPVRTEGKANQQDSNLVPNSGTRGWAFESPLRHGSCARSVGTTWEHLLRYMAGPTPAAKSQFDSKPKADEVGPTLRLVNR